MRALTSLGNEMMTGESGDEQASSVSMKSNHVVGDDQDLIF